MAKKSHGRILAKMLAKFALDADPEELEEAVDAVEEITNPEEPVPAPQPPVPEQDAGDDVIQSIMDRLDAIEAKLNGPAEDEEPEEDPLTKMEQELDAMEGAEEEPVVAEEETDFIAPDEDPDEVESRFVDPEALNEQDEDEVTEEEVLEEPVEDCGPKGSDCKGRDAARIAIRAIRPIIATLPPSQRKKAADAAVAQIRKASGMSAKATKNQYVALKRRKAADTRKSPEDIGKAIMAARNPHYKK